jgi:hypothetical protein
MCAAMDCLEILKRINNFEWNQNDECEELEEIRLTREINKRLAESKRLEESQARARNATGSIKSA